jgi:lipopolysaccharide export LptBFGC system permease protein LptF
MKLLDRYIIRQFLVNFVILLAVLMLLFILVDLMVDLDEFIEAGRMRADEYGGVVLATLYSIVDYFAPVTVLLYVFFSGLVVVAAMAFTFASLQRHRELTAILASGVSLYRVAGPIVVVGILLNGLALPARELIIPHVAPKLLRSKSEVKYDAMESFAIRFAPDGNNNLLWAGDYDVDRQRLSEVSIIRRNDQDIAVQRITAEAAEWDAARGGWRLEQASAVSPEVAGVTVETARARQREPSFFETDLSPDVLVSRQATDYPRFMRLNELQRMQHNQALAPELRATITQVMWSRFSLVVLNMLVLLMALPFFLCRSPMPMLGQSVKAAGVVLGVWGSGLVMLQIPSGVLSPAVAAWLPTALALPIGAIMVQFIRT